MRTGHATSRIDIALRGDDETTTLIVADDGPDVPPDSREQIFHSADQRA